jgi:hypothetical protein
MIQSYFLRNLSYGHAIPVTSTEVQQVFLLRQQIRCFQNRTPATIHGLLNAVVQVVPVLNNLKMAKLMTRDDEKI